MLHWQCVEKGYSWIFGDESVKMNQIIGLFSQVQQHGSGPFGDTSLYSLLSRIRWDKDFGSGTFEIGYWDRLRKEAVRISFEKIAFEPGNRESFLAMSPDGICQRIPFHRVHQVYKNGILIWDRG